MNKFAGSETLDFVADEAVQIHGGYGFMAEYEVERIYRDSRINRIFEGTNEINRLLVPGTLMRKALKGDLPFLQKAQALQEELMMLMPQEIDDTPLAQETHLLAMAKKVFLMVAGTGAQKYGAQLDQEQEVLAAVADIVSDIYSMESAILRTQKALDASSPEKEQQKLLLTEVFTQEAINRIEANAKKALSYMEEGDTLRTMLSMLRKLTRHQPVNVVAKKRKIAKAIIAEKKYVI